MNSPNNKTLCQIFNALMADEETVFVFDLDCTLLDTRPLYDQMRINAANLLVEHTGMSFEDAEQATIDALQDYNGYVREAFLDRYGIDKTLTTEAVYNPHTMDMSLVNVPDYLPEILEQIQGRAFVYTNSTSEYAQVMLEQLGLDQYFDGIYGTDSFDHTRKPDEDAFNKFMEETGAKAENIWFFEDSVENLKISGEMGWNTVFVTEFLEGNLHLKERLQMPLKVDRVIQSLSEMNPCEKCSSSRSAGTFTTKQRQP